MICEWCGNKKNIGYIKSISKFNNYFMCYNCIVNKKNRKKSIILKKNISYISKFIYSYYYLNNYKIKLESKYHIIYFIKNDNISI